MCRHLFACDFGVQVLCTGQRSHETQVQNPAGTTSDNVSYVRFWFGFSLGFRGSGEFPRGYTLSIDFQQISFSKQHRIPWSGFYWRLE